MIDHCDPPLEDSHECGLKGAVALGVGGDVYWAIVIVASASAMSVIPMVLTMSGLTASTISGEVDLKLEPAALSSKRSWLILLASQTLS